MKSRRPDDPSVELARGASRRPPGVRSTTPHTSLDRAGDAHASAGTVLTPEERGDEADSHLEALDENVAAIKSWEQATLLSRSKTEELADWIARSLASGPALLFHAVWFTVWMTVNTGFIPGIEPFDRFPFPFLTMVVSLEAIFLALFVLASQNRLAHQSDKRSHLDLQIDLLAEREMTAVLQMLQDIAAHLQVHTRVRPEHLRDLAKKTDIHSLTDRMEELSESHPLVAGEPRDHGSGRARAREHAGS